MAVHPAHDEVVHPAAPVAGRRAEGGAEGEGDGRGAQGDQQVDAPGVDEPRELVTPVEVGAERMPHGDTGQGGRGVGLVGIVGRQPRRQQGRDGDDEDRAERRERKPVAGEPAPGHQRRRMRGSASP